MPFGLAGEITLKEEYHRHYEEQIWNSHWVPQKEALLLELRNASKQVLAFHLVEVNNPSDEHELFEAPNWWMGVSGIYGERILIHEFTDTDNPDRKTLYSFDLETFECYWQTPETAQSQFDGKHLLIRTTTSPDQLQNVDLFTGKYSEITVAPPSARDIPEDRDLCFPHLYKEDSDYFGTVSEFLRSTLNIHPVRAVEYMELDHSIVISYYIYNGKSLDNFLIVSDLFGTIIAHEPLAEKLQGVGFQTFFVYRDKLIFVSFDNELRILNFLKP